MNDVLGRDVTIDVVGENTAEGLVLPNIDALNNDMPCNKVVVGKGDNPTEISLKDTIFNEHLGNIERDADTESAVLEEYGDSR